MPKPRTRRGNNPNLLSSISNLISPPRSLAESAKELARDFHGRDNRDTTEALVPMAMPKDVAQLGILIELQVLVGDAPEIGENMNDGDYDYLPISFAPEHPKEDDPEIVRLGGLNNVPSGSSAGGQLYFVGGNQDFDLEDFVESADLDFGEEEDLDVDMVCLGYVKAIAYFADKHHLEGPRAQKKGIPYQHEFAINEETGEVVGDFPQLYYWPKDKQFTLEGGSYEILPEGISG